MIIFKKKPFLSLFFIIFSLSLSSCSYFSKDKKKENEVEKITKKRFEPNVKKRLEDDRDRGISIFGKRKKEDTLGAQNIMWKATLETLDFMPINVASYSGGIISTDWYSKESGQESIKITVSFMSDQILASSINVKSYKKTCNKEGNCVVSEGSKNFDKQIKDQIVQKLKTLNIENLESKN